MARRKVKTAVASFHTTTDALAAQVTALSQQIENTQHPGHQKRPLGNGSQGGMDFSKLDWVLRADDPATKASELVAIQYGAFVNTLIQFLIVAWVIFLLVKGVNALRRQQEEAPAAPSPSEALLTEIRDLLKTKS